MWLPPKESYNIGYIEVLESEIVIAKKTKGLDNFLNGLLGIWRGILFGKKGGLNAKEYKRFSWSEISTVTNKTFRKKEMVCSLVTLNQEEYIFDLPNPTKQIQYIIDVFNKSK